MTQTSPDVGDLSDVEKETIARTRGGSIPWQIDGRDSEGNLVVAAVLPCGNRHPGMVRRCTLSVTPAGHVTSKGEPYRPS